MKKLSTVLLGLGLFVSSALYAAEANKPGLCNRKSA